MAIFSVIRHFSVNASNKKGTKNEPKLMKKFSGGGFEPRIRLFVAGDSRRSYAR